MCSDMGFFKRSSETNEEQDGGILPRHDLVKDSLGCVQSKDNHGTHALAQTDEVCLQLGTVNT